MSVLTEAKTWLDAQETKGLAEYGVPLDRSKLTDSQLLEAAIEEAADQLMYLVALRRRLWKVYEEPLTQHTKEG